MQTVISHPEQEEFHRDDVLEANIRRELRHWPERGDGSGGWVMSVRYLLRALEAARGAVPQAQPVSAADDSDAGDLTDVPGATPGADVDDATKDGPAADEQPPLCDCPALPSTHRHYPGGPELATLGDGDSQR